MSAFSIVDCTERAHTRTETWSPEEGLTCSVELLLAWEDRYKLIYDLMMNCLSRGWPFPKFYMDHHIPVPTNINIRPLRGQFYKASHQGIEYETAIAKVTYKPWCPIRETVEFQTQSIRLEPKLFPWSKSAYPDDGQQPTGLGGLTQTIHRLILVKEFDLIGGYHLQDGIPYNFYGTEVPTEDGSSGLTGTVHDKPYTSTLVTQKGTDSEGGAITTKFVRFAANTLLMLNPIIMDGPIFRRPIIENDDGFFVSDFNLSRGQRIKLKWLFRPEGHNKFWRPEKENSPSQSTRRDKRGGWESLKLKGANEDYEPFPYKTHTPFLPVMPGDKVDPKLLNFKAHFPAEILRDKDGDVYVPPSTS